jgi:hypothetical protein
LDLPHIGQLALALSYNMIKSENNLHEEELMGLVTDLFNSEHPETSPLGEKIIINYTNSDWNALFDH